MNDSAARTALGVALFVLTLGAVGDFTSGRSKLADSLPKRFFAVLIMALALIVLGAASARLSKALAWLIGVGYLFGSNAGSDSLAGISNMLTGGGMADRIASTPVTPNPGVGLPTGPKTGTDRIVGNRPI